MKRTPSFVWLIKALKRPHSWHLCKIQILIHSKAKAVYWNTFQKGIAKQMFRNYLQIEYFSYILGCSSHRSSQRLAETFRQKLTVFPGFHTTINYSAYASIHNGSLHDSVFSWKLVKTPSSSLSMEQSMSSYNVSQKKHVTGKCWN